VEIELDTTKTAAKNASELFERAKKLEEKLVKAMEVLKEMEEKKKKIEVKSVERKSIIREKKEKEWYEKFRWFFSSTGKMVIGGRDATSNEMLMKKHALDTEVVFHADITGAPFFVIKGEPDEATVNETAQAAGIFSKAWTAGHGSVEVFYAPRSQFSKSAPSGEYISKGAFMVYGKKEWKKVELKAGLGMKDGKAMCGPVEAVKKWSGKIMVLAPGEKKPGEIVKKASKYLEADPDDVQSVIPAGKTDIVPQHS
jgi:predicted ribosome quality control (RQC) complex YloA/Tae2 family protein